MNAQERSDLAHDLEGWWSDLAQEEVQKVVPKAVEYGANSMIEVGRTMARLAHREVTDEEATEMACMFYIAGKVGRWVDAVAAGDRPSDDTLHDIGVYARMAQRIRFAGGWPGSAPEPTEPTEPPGRLKGWELPPKKEQGERLDRP